MRRIFVAIAAAAALLSLLSFAPNRAEAMTLPAPSALQTTLEGANMVEQAAYVCRRRCNRRGCWRSCYWTAPAPYYGYYRPYYYGRPYYHRRWWW
jgi:hypothetical protein